MLAPSFKTAAELGLTDKQHKALHDTLDLMEAGEIEHVSEFGGPPYEWTGHRFNMGLWFCPADSSCGSVGCIGGTAEFLAQDNNLFDGIECADPSLYALFYPGANVVYNYNAITVAQAAHALRNYLTIGEPCWDQCL